MLLKITISILVLLACGTGCKPVDARAPDTAAAKGGGAQSPKFVKFAATPSADEDPKGDHGREPLYGYYCVAGMTSYSSMLCSRQNYYATTNNFANASAATAADEALATCEKEPGTNVVVMIDVMTANGRIDTERLQNLRENGDKGQGLGACKKAP